MVPGLDLLAGVRETPGLETEALPEKELGLGPQGLCGAQRDPGPVRGGEGLPHVPSPGPAWPSHFSVSKRHACPRPAAGCFPSLTCVQGAVTWEQHVSPHRSVPRGLGSFCKKTIRPAPSRSRRGEQMPVCNDAAQSVGSEVQSCHLGPRTVTRPPRGSGCAASGNRLPKV